MDEEIILPPQVEIPVVEEQPNIWLVFDIKDQAEIANAVISYNMRLAGSITQKWAEIRQRLDGKYVIPKPPVAMMKRVDIIDGYVEEEYDPSWFESGV